MFTMYANSVLHNHYILAYMHTYMQYVYIYIHISYIDIVLPLDEISAEVWKTGHFNHILLEFCYDVYSQIQIENWTKGGILPFPKKGDLTVTDNYSGITLTCIAAKIYNTLLRERIQPTLDMIIRPNKNGFRNNRSTVGQILTVRRIIEGVKEKNLEVSIIFVDFSKDFDSIHREKME